MGKDRAKMTLFSVELPNGGRLTFESERNVTHAIVLSPPDLEKWKARVQERLDSAKAIVKSLHNVSRRMRINHNISPNGVDVLTLVSIDDPGTILLSHSNTEESSHVAERRLVQKAHAEYTVAVSASKNARELLANLESQVPTDTEYRILATGGPEITSRIGNLKRYEEEGRTVSLDRVDIVDVSTVPSADATDTISA